MPTSQVQPIQSLHLDQGVLRFVPNKVVLAMLDMLKEHGQTLNDVHRVAYDAPAGDWDQFNQLIGYSVSNAPIDETIKEVALARYKDKRKSSAEIKLQLAEAKLKAVKSALKQATVELFDIHPDDLT